MKSRKFVWQVTIRPKGLSISKNMCGQYRLCLSDVAVCFYKPSSDTADYVFQLASIRRCGHSDNFFYMEVGRSAPTGDGELWMQVEDKDIAKNLHEEVLKHMRSSSDEFRGRSSTGLSRHNVDDSSHIRQRTNSESKAHGSPRRNRVSTLENKRPQSTVVMQRTTAVTQMTEPPHIPHPAMFEPPPPSGPSYLNELSVPPHGHRFRSDSAESHGSRCSVKSTTDIFGSSPAEMFLHPVNRSMTPDSLPKPITEESSAYLDMSPEMKGPFSLT
ncbi:hypothetical protein KUTeg_000263 [Tegillarca granosa]|uniref:IRS-type PTB domain-containing protein n=1 Tax=Tegillarca granosa TaxID=220873 RepID=A0ABQ9G0H5_TEGGR|nr:hypothetical protein KUTeg_000263 [Tegillarca granosa]